jgi:transposase-like protein
LGHLACLHFNKPTLIFPQFSGHPEKPNIYGRQEVFHHGKRHIDKEFKIEAVPLASEPGNTQAGIERDLGISQGIISRWKCELFKDGDQAFPGKKTALNPMTMPCSVSSVKMNAFVGSVTS